MLAASYNCKFLWNHYYTSECITWVGWILETNSVFGSFMTKGDQNLSTNCLMSLIFQTSSCHCTANNSCSRWCLPLFTYGLIAMLHHTMYCLQNCGGFTNGPLNVNQYTIQVLTIINNHKVWINVLW